MPIPDGMRFSLAPVLKRLNEIDGMCSAWKSGLAQRENPVFEADDFKTLLQTVLPALELPADVVELTEDGYGLHVRDTAQEEQITYQYLREVSGTDRLLPFKEMLLWYTGRTITRELISTIYWRLAAGRDWMLKGRFMAHDFPASGRTTQFWTGLHISSCGYGPLTKNGKLQLTLGFRAMSGPYAGLTFTQHIPYFVVTRKIAKEIGFPVYQKTHYNELVQCVFVGYVSLDLWGDRLTPKVIEYHVSSMASKINRDLRRRRAEECQHAGYTWPCYQCPRGYADTANRYCYRAVRPFALQLKLCPQCNQQSYFDVAVGSSVCVSCQARPFKFIDR